MRDQGEEMKRFISDEIGDEYQEWRTQNVVFLTAPTGSGKTTFVLEKLVGYAESRNAKIIYLVNRKILKKQIMSIINSNICFKVKNVKEVIEVKTYQELEEKYKNGIGNPDYERYTESVGEMDKWKGNIPRYDIVVADECHYFFSDSTYNPHTWISYDWIMYHRYWSILIFMSATIDRIKEYILKDIEYKRVEPIPEQNLEQTQSEKATLKTSIKYPTDRILKGELCVKEYTAKADYSHIDVHILDGIDSIIDVVKEKKKKWMIFVDSIKKGRYIHDALLNSEVDSVFIDARWEDDNDDIVLDSIGNMVKEQDFKQQVVVAISVIDNGISIKNVELRNLVVMADTKEQFIQMLGRKRLSYDEDKKPEKINLFLLKNSKENFSKRLSYVESNMEYIGKYYDSNDDHKTVLEKIQKSQNWYRCFRNVCYVTKESVVLNKFSIEQYAYLRDNYVDIINRFEDEDEYAFVRKQAEWIGIEGIEDVINEYKEAVKYKVGTIINKYMGIKLEANKNAELRNLIRVDLKEMLKEYEGDDAEGKIKKIISDLGKRSSEKEKRPFTDERFNFIMDVLNMGYRMENRVIKKL